MSQSSTGAVRKSTASRKSKRHKPERWLHWELDFIEECFDKTQYPSRSLRHQWAQTLTEIRHEHAMSSYESSDESSEKDWVSHYQRRIANWFKNRKARIRREERIMDEDQEESFLASSAEDSMTNYSEIAAERYTMDSDRDEEEFLDDSPESEEGQSATEEADSDPMIQTDYESSCVVKMETDESSISEFKFFEQPVYQPVSDNIPFFEIEDRPLLTFPISACRNERYP